MYHFDEEAIGLIDWADTDAVHATLQPILQELGQDPRRLGQLVKQCLADPDLRGRCERSDILDRLLLYDNGAGVRLRLHVFPPGYHDRKHNHRWAFTNYIMCGGYTQVVYAMQDLGSPGEEANVLLTPVMTTVEKAGDSYTLASCMAHSVAVTHYTATLMMRGPAIAERSLVTDRVTNRSWWKYGAEQESEADFQARIFTDRDIAAFIRGLSEAGVIQ